MCFLDRKGCITGKMSFSELNTLFYCLYMINRLGQKNIMISDSARITQPRLHIIKVEHKYSHIPKKQTKKKHHLFTGTFNPCLI